MARAESDPVGSVVCPRTRDPAILPDRKAIRGCARLAWAGALLFLLAVPAGAQGLYEDEERRRDRDSGVFTPLVGRDETFEPSVEPLEGMGPEERLAFASQINELLFNRPGEFSFVAFATGRESERLVISAIRDDYVGTEFQARSFLEGLGLLTASLPALVRPGVGAPPRRLPDQARLLGFVMVTVSDGGDFAIEIELE